MMNHRNTLYLTGDGFSIRLRFFLTLFIGCVILSSCGEPTLTKKESFHANGTLWEQWYEDNAGFKQGKALTYYDNGQLQTEAIFENGYLNGEFVMWSKESAELCRGTYKNGEPWTGTFISTDGSQQRVVFNTYESGNLIK